MIREVKIMNVTKWYEKFTSGSEKFFLFQDFWKLVQSYWRMEDTEEYWDSLYSACVEFDRKYRSYFAAMLVNAFLDEQERKLRGWKDCPEECIEKKQEQRIEELKKSVIGIGDK